MKVDYVDGEFTFERVEAPGGTPLKGRGACVAR